MLVHCTKYEKKIIEGAERLNDTIAKLQNDLATMGIRFSRNDWKHVVSGRVKDLREFIFNRWSATNPIDAHTEEAKNAARAIVENTAKYNDVFNGTPYDAVFEFRFDIGGVPSIDMSTLRSVITGLCVIGVESLSADELKAAEREAAELTNKAKNGAFIDPKGLKPGFRIVWDREKQSEEVTFDEMAHYRDMARMIIAVRDKVTL
jgi:hypothetical protein